VIDMKTEKEERSLIIGLALGSLLGIFGNIIANWVWELPSDFYHFILFIISLVVTSIICFVLIQQVFPKKLKYCLNQLNIVKKFLLLIGQSFIQQLKKANKVDFP